MPERAPTAPAGPFLSLTDPVVAHYEERLRRLIADFGGVEVELGSVDITFHRDDVVVRGGERPLHAQPVVKATKLDFPLEGITCVLVDDVLYTGRTIRASWNSCARSRIIPWSRW